MGMGDFLICNGLIRKLIKTQEEYSIFVHKKNYESVDFMFKDLKNIKDERKFLEKTNNKFITNLKYAFQSNSYLFLVMELASGGNLI